MKIFVVSSDVFERYVYRKGNSEKYMEQNVSDISTKYLPVLEMILNERLCHLPVRVFFNLPYIMCMNLDVFVGLLDNF